jgi:hypothetical protein
MSQSSYLIERIVQLEKENSDLKGQVEELEACKGAEVKA